MLSLMISESGYPLVSAICSMFIHSLFCIGGEG